MDAALELIREHGYWLLLGVGFAEYSGAPIASVPVLVAGGALVRTDILAFAPTMLTAATGALLADLFWFFMARWRGDRLMDTACGLTSNPNACILSVEEKVGRIGSPFLLVAKFIPGAGNLIAPAAGLAAVPPLRFLALDAIALLAWAGVYVGIGWIFASEIEQVIELVARYSSFALWAALALVLSALAWRFLRLRLHRHPDPGSSGAQSPDQRA